MDASRFRFSLTVPRDVRFVQTVRSLAVQAARYASCAEPVAERFGGSVEGAVRACLHEASPDTSIAVEVRRHDGPLEFLVDGHIVAVTP